MNSTTFHLGHLLEDAKFLVSSETIVDSVKREAVSEISYCNEGGLPSYTSLSTEMLTTLRRTHLRIENIIIVIEISIHLTPFYTFHRRLHLSE